MKKAALFLIALSLILSGQPSPAEENVFATVPSFKIILNGAEIEGGDGEYPFLVYKDVTYLPMTYGLIRFMGLQTQFGPTSGGGYAFYVGNAGEYAEGLEISGEALNDESSYAATIPEYSIYINDTRQEIDNSAEDYPVLNFRGVTYIPLTWRFAHDEFGWEYFFDGENGLVIDSRDALRPEWNPSRIYTNLPPTIDTFYITGDDCYAGYPPSTYGGQYEFVWKIRGGEERRFSLEEELTALGITYFCQQADENGYPTFVEPSLSGSVLTIYCTGTAAEAVNPEKPWVNVKNWVLNIDMEKGELVSAEELALMEV